MDRQPVCQKTEGKIGYCDAKDNSGYAQRNQYHIRCKLMLQHRQYGLSDINVREGSGHQRKDNEL